MQPRVSHHLAWSDSLLVGNPRIDAEHREIFELLANLWSDAPLARAECLRILVSHLTDHFDGEESSPQFQALAPAEAEQHRHEHHQFRAFMHQAESLAESEEGEFAAVIVSFIQEKLIPHIRGRDKLLGGK
jgi:hemerythrin-like metal-binding protein